MGDIEMAIFSVVYRLPTSNWPRAVFESDYSFETGRLLVDDEPLLEFSSLEALKRGAEARLPGTNNRVSLKVIDPVPGAPEIELEVDGLSAVREDHLRVPAARSAWLHAWIALAASFFGFVASYLYMRKAELFGDAWALKMGIHTAGWHLLLTLTLFPASVFGQRFGIRAVQGVSLVFFLIHAGIAFANTGGESQAIDGPWIALFNALSGVFFFIAVIYGQRAHRDMDPLRSLDEISASIPPKPLPDGSDRA